MQKPLPPWLPRVLVESTLIVFSVLFALILNEWRETEAQEERVELALAAIRSEVQENQRLVEDALKYHMQIASSFSASVESGSALPDVNAASQGLLAPARVLRTAWESAQSTGVSSEIPYTTVLKLSTAYARQTEYEDLSRSVSQVLYSRLLQEGVDSMMQTYPRVIFLQKEFAGRERSLLQHYEDARKALP